ncbi:phenol 2-monooxygenase [Rhizodiscina lignyota]|uniref:Phenol 2-monooxygenase n=1 Tax=Rhizodiscina lignyota TaxID=1504668 RepID=A0A9P4M605_9PEZI|nr:phenol 2-monooxygenase [Rhizodiscina lignyota]
MRAKTSYSDLVIIGAGPAGLMAASWASRLQLNARILDDKADRIQNGRADGLHVRTMEILDSFGMATPIEKASQQIREICSWNPHPEDENRIQRTQRFLPKEEDFGRYCQVAIHQGFIEQNFLDFLEKDGPLSVERNIKTESLEFDKADMSADNDYPITLRISHKRSGRSEEAQGADLELPETEFIKTKYLLGTDGGHSWTRQQLGLEMGDGKTRRHFGVIDIIPITDFPDVRTSCAIHSTNTGSLMTIPREGRLVRFYVQLGETGSSGDELDTEKITPRTIADKASEILSPYKLDYDFCDWWSVYTIGQRFASQFDLNERIFLAGDAVHTHSPTMGAGMNVSVQDTYNLVWKIGQVVKGIAQPRVLSTYNAEREAVAEKLMDMDHKMSEFYAAGPGKDARNYNKFRGQFQRFLSGVSVEYGPNILVPDTHERNPSTPESQNGSDKAARAQLFSKQSVSRKIIVGQRLPSHLVINQAEASIVHVHSILRSDGRWRLLVLAGDISKPAQMSRLESLCEYLANPSSFVYAYTPNNAKNDAVIEILMIHAAPREKVELLDLPEILHPFDPKLGYDYWKCFSNNDQGVEGEFSDAYEEWGVNKDKGCIAVLRPDQHVSYLGDLEDIKDMEHYFSQVLQPQKKRN